MEQRFTLNFTTEQLQIIDKALQQIPYFMAQPLLAEINKQLSAPQEGAGKQTAEDIPWKSVPPANGQCD